MFVNDLVRILNIIFRDDVGNYGIPQKRLHGHGHFISDVVLR